MNNDRYEEENRHENPVISRQNHRMNCQQLWSNTQASTCFSVHSQTTTCCYMNERNCDVPLISLGFTRPHNDHNQHSFHLDFEWHSFGRGLPSTKRTECPRYSHKKAYHSLPFILFFFHHPSFCFRSDIIVMFGHIQRTYIFHSLSLNTQHERRTLKDQGLYCVRRRDACL